MSKQSKFNTLFFITLVTLASCNQDEEIKGLKPNEILVVTLDISDDIDIKQVTMKSTNGTNIVTGTQIGNRRKIKLKTPQRGEGTFSICVFTTTDTLCSQESYIEGGYRPELKLKNREFQTIKWH